MLILTRKKGQSIVINNNIEIIVSAVDGDQIKLGIIAPPEVNILRKEVLLAVQQSNREAVESNVDLAELKKLTRPE
ncbi:carbon storage regulator [Paenibacillus elgii]|uniref:carbon storage regulator n=1 Tax=Paenibacillus elgii TaxID=189691 RepID=UPI0013D1C803|nr:carbon storage regulator [Paenibacillus elgii]